MSEQAGINNSDMMSCRYLLWFVYNDELDIRQNRPNLTNGIFRDFVRGIELLFEKARGSWNPERRNFATIMQKSVGPLAEASNWSQLRVILKILLLLAYTNTPISTICA